MFTIEFWKAAGERAIWTIAQSAVAAIGVGAVGFGDVNWIAVASIAGVAGVVSILKSIIVNGATGTGPSVTTAEQIVPEGSTVTVD